MFTHELNQLPIDNHYHDLTKWLSYYFFSFLDLLHKKEVQEGVTHHSHNSGDIT